MRRVEYAVRTYKIFGTYMIGQIAVREPLKTQHKETHNRGTDAELP